MITIKNKKEFNSLLDEEAKKFLKDKVKFSSVSFPGDTLIFRDYIVIFSWEDVPIASLIKSKNLAQQYKNFFLGLWQKAKPA